MCIYSNSGRNLVQRRSSCSDLVFMGKRVSHIEVYRQLVEVCGDGVRNVKYRKMAQWVHKLLNSYLPDDKRTGRSGSSRTDVNAARVEETDLRQKRHFEVR